MTGPAEDHPHAEVHLPRGLRLIWLIPLVALLLALYLGVQALHERGPTITIVWNTAEGLLAGQTKVTHRAVELGVVERINLTDDLAHVQVQVRMRREAEPLLTDQTRLWVVRPRVTARTISGLNTLVSGAYIELDPGSKRGSAAKLNFTGLDDPPAVRSDEPGHTFTLRSDRIGSLSSGSPLFFRDIPAGEVLSYNLRPDDQGVVIQVFVRAPYDAMVRRGTRFWNASGVSLDLGAQGVRLKLNSLMALLNGGVAFDTPAGYRDGPPPDPALSFPLYNDEATALASGYRGRIKLLTRFDGSVRGLAVGAPVELYGIQIGTVTDVQLDFDTTGASSGVTVRFEVQPERMAPMGAGKSLDTAPLEVARRLVARGLRMELTTANYLTGQQVLTMGFVPHAPPFTVVSDGDTIVLPGRSGGIDAIVTAAGSFVAKLNALPLEAIGSRLAETLKGTSGLANGGALQNALKTLNEALAATRDMARSLQAGVGPAAKKLPQLAQGLQTALDRVNGLVASVDSGYGANSAFERDVTRLLGQIGDAARSMRLLADYLDAHPDALLRGRGEVKP